MITQLCFDHPMGEIQDLPDVQERIDNFLRSYQQRTPHQFDNDSLLDGANDSGDCDAVCFDQANLDRWNSTAKTVTLLELDWNSTGTRRLPPPCKESKCRTRWRKLDPISWADIPARGHGTIAPRAPKVGTKINRNM